MISKSSWVWAFIACACATAGQGAPAAPSPSAPVVESVLKCRGVTDPSQRLNCYDAAVSTMADATAKGDLVAVDREQRRALRRQAFGLSLPSFTIFDRGEHPDEADRLTATVASAFRDPHGRWVIKLADGAVWRQIDDNEIFREPRPGSTVTISRAALGSFFLKVDGQQAVRAHREN